MRNQVLTRKRLTLREWNSLSDHARTVEMAVEHKLQEHLDALLDSLRNGKGSLPEIAVLLAKLGV